MSKEQNAKKGFNKLKMLRKSLVKEEQVKQGTHLMQYVLKFRFI